MAIDRVESDHPAVTVREEGTGSLVDPRIVRVGIDEQALARAASSRIRCSLTCSVRGRTTADVGL